VLFWCNLASAGVVCVGGIVLWPTVRSLCAPDFASFHSQVDSDGWPELQRCARRLTDHSSEWGRDNLGGVASGAVWSTETSLFLMVHLMDALCTCLLVAFTWTSSLLRLVCLAVATAATATAEARCSFLLTHKIKY